MRTDEGVNPEVEALLAENARLREALSEIIGQSAPWASIIATEALATDAVQQSGRNGTG